MIGPAEPRRFVLLDGIVFVAATAVGLTLARQIDLDWSFPQFPRQPRRGLVMLHVALLHVAVVLVCEAAAVAACGLIPPDSGRRLRLRGPGLIACLCVSVYAPATWGFYVAMPHLGLNTGYHTGGLLYSWLGRSAAAVTLCWSTLLLTGGWRTEPSWPDRAGRALAFAFIGLEMLSWAWLICVWTIG